MDDQNIIKRVLNGEVDAYARLVQRHHRNLLAFIFRLVGDAHLAEDIGQEVFLKAYKELPNFDVDRGTPFAAWLFIIARNQCISELRTRGRSETVADDFFRHLAAGGDNAETALIRREELQALQATLQELPEPFRTTIIMSLKGETLEEIARRCGVPRATVKTRLFRAREKIALLLNGYFGGIGHERSI
jgi:RNA polymerase sigma-70 factor (ECF subfamily)